MKSKFDFYEIVRITSNELKYCEINNTDGTILGMSQNDDGSWGYLVACEKECWDLPENILIKTGMFSSQDKFYTGTSIRIAVDDNGVGSVKASYNSYTEIENAISMSQASKASGYMIEAGMTSNDLDIMYNLIFIAIQHPDYIIRSSGYSALWHLLLRFKNKVSSQVLMKTLRIGLTDKNEHVLETVNCIIEDLQNIAPDVLEQIEKYK